MLDTYLDFVRDRALTALAGFEGIVEKAGVISSEQCLLEEETGEALCLRARYSDLLIMSQRDPEEVLPAQRVDVLEYVLTHSPRPVLVIPYVALCSSVGKRIVIAWNGSTQAARAVAAALPLLKLAHSVQVVVFNATRALGVHGEEPGADIALYLARHGVKVDVCRRSTAPDDDDVGSALLTHLADVDADMLVMGAFGQSRFREFLLGGVTRTMLQSMTVPVLMSQ